MKRKAKCKHGKIFCCECEYGKISESQKVRSVRAVGEQPKKRIGHRIVEGFKLLMGADNANQGEI